MVKKTKQKPKAHKSISIRIVDFECTLHLVHLNLQTILTETDEDYFPLVLRDASAIVQGQLENCSNEMLTQSG